MTLDLIIFSVIFLFVFAFILVALYVELSRNGHNNLTKLSDIMFFPRYYKNPPVEKIIPVTETTILKRGQLIRKAGSTRTTIREQESDCRICKTGVPGCPACHGSGRVVCELIINIFPV